MVTIRFAGELPAGVRRARRRDLVRVAAVFVSSMERPRRHPPRLRRLIPVRPLRLAVYWLTGLVIVLFADIVLVAGSPSALLAIDEQDPKAWIRKVARSLGIISAFGVPVLVLTLALPTVVFEVLQGTVIAMAGWCAVRLLIANRPLRALIVEGRAWAATLPGPAWWLTGYGSVDPKAAITLGYAVCELADAAEVVLLAVAEGTARIHAYQRAGFTVHRHIDVDQESGALLVRWPVGSRSHRHQAPGRSA